MTDTDSTNLHDDVEKLSTQLLTLDALKTVTDAEVKRVRSALDVKLALLPAGSREHDGVLGRVKLKPATVAVVDEAEFLAWAKEQGIAPRPVRTLLPEFVEQAQDILVEALPAEAFDVVEALDDVDRKRALAGLSIEDEVVADAVSGEVVDFATVKAGSAEMPDSPAKRAAKARAAAWVQKNVGNLTTVLLPVDDA